jgi:hypothetical protein
MASERNVWFRVGYALERARTRREDGEVVEATPAESPSDRKEAGPVEATPRGEVSPLVEKALAAAVVAGGGGLVTAALRAWRPRGTPGPLGLARAGAAGAGAAVARMVIQRLLDLGGAPEAEADPLAPVLAGAARGLVYASVVEPRLPGPPILRGAVYGGLEFGASPWGGLEGLLDTLPPHRRVPFLAALLDARDNDPTLAGHLLFGVILASLYGRGPSGRGL